MPAPYVKPLSILLLSSLLVSLTGCAAPSVSPPVAIACPAPVPMPLILHPPPAIDYSLRAQQTLSEWQRQLQGTPATSKP